MKEVERLNIEELSMYSKMALLLTVLREQMDEMEATSKLLGETSKSLPIYRGYHEDGLDALGWIEDVLEDAEATVQRMQSKHAYKAKVTIARSLFDYLNEILELDDKVLEFQGKRVEFGESLYEAKFEFENGYVATLNVKTNFSNECTINIPYKKTIKVAQLEEQHALFLEGNFFICEFVIVDD